MIVIWSMLLTTACTMDTFAEKMRIICTRLQEANTDNLWATSGNPLSQLIYGTLISMLSLVVLPGWILFVPSMSFSLYCVIHFSPPRGVSDFALNTIKIPSHLLSKSMYSHPEMLPDLSQNCSKCNSKVLEIPSCLYVESSYSRWVLLLF